jgi:glutamine amidotransferase
VVIVDNGGANIASLRFALQRLGCEPELASDPERIHQASHVILPGVGAAGDAMRRLRAQRLAELIPQLTQPVLGICLGMQLLYAASVEGDTTCLGAIPGAARRLQGSPQRPVPHMGWNQLRLLHSAAAGTLIRDIARDIVDGDYVYFVHSYALPVNTATVALTEYGEPFAAIAAHRNFFGAQFHPERSGKTGALLLRNFLELS